MNPAFEATVTYTPEPAGAHVRRAASWLQRAMGPWGELPASVRDRSTGLYDRTAFFAAANEMIRARAPGTPVSLVVLDVTDLREVYQIYGHGIARKVVARLVRRLRALAGWRGIAGRTGSVEFTVVLVGATQEKALGLLQRALGRPARVEFDAGDSEIVLVPDVLVDTTEPGAESVQPLYREMARELARIQKEERRRLDFLASERERHSRPMSIGQLR